MAKNFVDIINVVGKIIFYILAIILLYQILRAILGGTWSTEDMIIALVIFNLTATLTLFGLIYKLNAKISDHIGWHRGLGNAKKK